MAASPSSSERSSVIDRPPIQRNTSIVNPVTGLVTGQKRYTPFKRFKERKEFNLDDEDLFHCFVEYNKELATRGACDNKNKRKGGPGDLQCDCLKVLQEKDEFLHAVAEYQLHFASLSQNDRQKAVMESLTVCRFIKEASHNNKRANEYPIPFLRLAEQEAEKGDEEDDIYAPLRNYTICSSALMDLLGVGKSFWATCSIHSLSNTLPGHKHRGRQSNSKRKWNDTFEDSLIDHFEALRKEAGPIATRFVRESSGQVTTRDDDDRNEYLSCDLTKRQCYGNYCDSRGIIIRTNNKGNITKIVKNATNNWIQDDLETRQPTLPVPSWGAYLAYWDREYPFLKVSRPAEDICSYCYVFHNKWKYRTSTPTTIPSGAASAVDDGDDNSSASSDSSLHSNKEPEKAQQVEEDEERLEDDDSIDEDTLKSERAVIKAALHVRMARAQRQLVNEKIEAARADRNKPHNQRTYTYIVDYGQNMSLPWFGCSQPGEVYYYTPLKVYNLGIVDVSDESGDHLYCHIYKEGDGLKGANNVASLLLKTLHDLLVLRTTKGKELNIVFDNCPGQNKNNVVLCLVPYLIELVGHFETVNFIFLVVGHTKNAADRLFNALKLIYRSKDVYSFKDLLAICNHSPHVTVCRVGNGDFYDYKACFTKFYLAIKPLKSKHIFTCSYQEDTSTVMISTRVSNLEEHTKVEVNILRKTFYDKTEYSDLPTALAARRELLNYYPLVSIPFPGLPSFKQVQLYKNYRKFLPAEYKDITCPRPSDEVMKSEKEDQTKRRLAKKDSKKKSTSKVASSSKKKSGIDNAGSNEPNS